MTKFGFRGVWQGAIQSVPNPDVNGLVRSHANVLNSWSDDWNSMTGRFVGN